MNDQLSAILRQMRSRLGISQLELALRLHVSQRHVSFVELGRARPSRGLILNWAKETGASVDASNAALISAGYSPAILELGTSAARSSTEFRALSQMIVAHDPFPGIVFDADWMILAMNEGGQWLSSIAMPGFLASMDGPPFEMDMIAAVAHPGGILSNVQNAPEVGSALLRQLRTEQMTRPQLEPRVDRLEQALKERFGHADLSSVRPAAEPYLNLVVDSGYGTLSFLLVQTLFGLPQNISIASLRSELWFPTDDATRSVMLTNRSTAVRCAMVA